MLSQKNGFGGCGHDAWAFWAVGGVTTSIRFSTFWASGRSTTPLLECPFRGIWCERDAGTRDPVSTSYSSLAVLHCQVQLLRRL